MKNKDNGPKVKQWIHRGKMLINSDALPPDDPDNTYNQIKAQGYIPEDYGFEHESNKRFKNYSREDLIEMILDLEKEIDFERCRY